MYFTAFLNKDDDDDDDDDFKIFDEHSVLFVRDPPPPGLMIHDFLDTSPAFHQSTTK